MLGKEHNYFITTNLNSHVSTNSVLNNYTNKGTHHKMEV